MTGHLICINLALEMKQDSAVVYSQVKGSVRLHLSTVGLS